MEFSMKKVIYVSSELIADARAHALNELLVCYLQPLLEAGYILVITD
jgi:hypothetical protein